MAETAGPLSPAAREAFLQRGIVCRLAFLDRSGYPCVVPVWFEHADGGFYVIARARSSWAGDLERDGRVSLCIDSERSERVLVRGRARLVERPNAGDRWVPIARRMAARYMGERGAAYLERTLDEPRWLFFVEPQRVTSWQGGWAARYKHSDW